MNWGAPCLCTSRCIAAGVSFHRWTRSRGKSKCGSGHPPETYLFSLTFLFLGRWGSLGGHNCAVPSAIATSDFLARRILDFSGATAFRAGLYGRHVVSLAKSDASRSMNPRIALEEGFVSFKLSVLIALFSIQLSSSVPICELRTDTPKVS
jgi:hypothetical protein